MIPAKRGMPSKDCCRYAHEIHPHLVIVCPISFWRPPLGRQAIFRPSSGNTWRNTWATGSKIWKLPIGRNSCKSWKINPGVSSLYSLESSSFCFAFTLGSLPVTACDSSVALTHSKEQFLGPCFLLFCIGGISKG